MRAALGTACATSTMSALYFGYRIGDRVEQSRTHDLAGLFDGGGKSAGARIDDLDEVAGIQAQHARDLMRVSAVNLDRAAGLLFSLDEKATSRAHSGTKRVLHPVEKRPLFNGVTAGVGIGFEKIALPFVELRRHDDVHAHVMVAAMRAAHAGHAVPAQAQRRSRLRSRRQRQFDVAVERRHADRRAKRGLWKAHRHVDERLASFAPKNGMLRDRQIDEEIAGGSAAQSAFAAAGDANARAIVDAGRNVHRQARFGLEASSSGTAFARRRGDVPLAAAALANRFRSPFVRAACCARCARCRFRHSARRVRSSCRVARRSRCRRRIAPRRSKTISFVAP